LNALSRAGVHIQVRRRVGLFPNFDSMTPPEEFTHKRAQAESLIRQHAPARLQEQLIALLRPAIALTATRTDDAQIEGGASKFGGAC